MDRFYMLPLWLVCASTVGLLLGSFEMGFLIGRYRAQRSEREKDSPVGPMVGATLGLLAFMLSFPFGVSASHFDTRQQLVLDEANAIRSVYMMADMLAEAPCRETRMLLREYVNMRLEAFRDMKHLSQSGFVRISEIRDRLWSIAMAGETKSTGVNLSGIYVQALSDMFDLQVMRISAGLHGRIQMTIWVVLFSLASLGIAGMGYHSGLVRKRGFFAYMVLILTFSLVIVLIYDLDRPMQGLFKVSQQALVDLQQMMGAGK